MCWSRVEYCCQCSRVVQGVKLNAGFPPTLIQEAGVPAWTRPENKEALNGELRMPVADEVPGPLWDVSKLAPKGKITGCTKCWAVTRDPRLTMSHFADSCVFKWADKEGMSRGDPVAIVCVALSLQWLQPSDATGKHVDTIFSELGVMPSGAQGERVSGDRLLSAVRTQRDAVVPFYGQALLGVSGDGAWVREGTDELVGIDSVVRAYRQLVATGSGCEFMGSELALRVGGAGEPVAQKSRVGPDGDDQQPSRVQLLQSGKYRLVLAFSPREVAASMSKDLVSSGHKVSLSTTGGVKGAGTFSLMLFAPEKEAFPVPRALLTASMERLKEAWGDAETMCSNLGMAFPISDIGLAAANLKEGVERLVRMQPDLVDCYPIVAAVDRVWVDLAERQFLKQENERPSAAEWHFGMGATVMACAVLVSAPVVSAPPTPRAAQSPTKSPFKGKQEVTGSSAAALLNGCCASFVAGEGACGGAVPGSACTVVGKRTGRLFKHECPCGEQHKAVACKKLKPKDLVAAAKVLMGKK